MNLGLKGKKALVTGGTKGIGLAIARSLAAEGMRVAVAARSRSALPGNGHASFVVDLAAEKGPRTLVSRLKRDFGPPDVVVHNLGGSLGVRDALAPVKDWRRVFRLNFEVAAELNALLVPAMKERRSGRIIHISSSCGVENLGSVTYCSAKAALNAYTRSLGRVLAPEGIVVCAVCPGMTQSGPWDASSEYLQKKIKEQMPMGRCARPEEIASMVTFLASDLSTQCAGAIVPVDGGSLRGFAV